MPFNPMTQMPGGQPQPADLGFLQRLNQGLAKAGMGENALLGLGSRMLQGSQGQGLGRPAMGFGQGIGNAMQGQMQETQDLTQQAYRNTMMKREIEDREKRSKDYAEARKQAAEDRQAAAELATRRYEAEQARQLETARLTADYRSKQLEQQGQNQGSISEFVDLATRPVEEGGAGWTADQAMTRYLQRGSMMFPGMMGGGPGGPADPAANPFDQVSGSFDGPAGPNSAAASPTAPLSGADRLRAEEDALLQMQRQEAMNRQREEWKRKYGPLAGFAGGWDALKRGFGQ